VYAGVDHGVKAEHRMSHSDAADTRFQRSGVRRASPEGPLAQASISLLFATLLFEASVVMMLLSSKCGKDDRNIERYWASDLCSAEAFSGVMILLPVNFPHGSSRSIEFILFAH
jgi:hypothetical protein